MGKVSQSSCNPFLEVIKDCVGYEFWYHVIIQFVLQKQQQRIMLSKA